jgi:hypothetical protein
MQKPEPINLSELNQLKIRHSLAVDEMLASIDKVNTLKSEIFKIEAERDKNGLWWMAEQTMF